MTTSKLKNALESFYLIPAIFILAVLGRLIDVVNITLPLIALLVILILFFCDDVRNVLAIIFYAPFYIKDIVDNANFILFSIVIALVIIALLIFTIRRIKQLKTQNQLIKGKLYLPLALITVAYLLGGIAFDFNIISAIVILVFSSATFFFYFIALNCANDLHKFLSKTFLLGAIFVGFMVLYENYVKHGGMQYIFNRSYDTWVGAENINVASLFIMLGMFGAFSLGYKTKKDALYLVITSVLYLLVIVTYCRMLIAIGGVGLLIMVVFGLIKSPYKKKYIIYLFGLIVCAIVLILIFWDVIGPVWYTLLHKKGLTGREELWPWCIKMFKENFLFGIGFKIAENVPMMGEGASNYVLAHNTALQWLTSLGVVGTLCMITFTAFKYKIVFKNFFKDGVILRLLIIFIALSGITDQAPQMDPFIYNIVIVLIASIEKLVFHKKIKEKENEKN